MPAGQFPKDDFASYFRHMFYKELKACPKKISKKVTYPYEDFQCK